MDLKIIIFVMLCFFTVQANAATLALTNCAFDIDKKGSRVILSLSNIADYNTFTLDKPSRIVIDIKNASKKMGRCQKNPLVKRVRFGNPKKDTLRVVLDLKKAAKIKDSFFILPKKGSKFHKLVVVFGNGERVAGYNSKATINIPVLKSFKLKGYKDIRPVTKPRSVLSGYKPIIVIDSGHGGIDPGAVSRTGTKEKYITLKYALTLKKTLEKTGKYRVVLTRSSDRFINLGKRVDIANKTKGDLFISLHADSNPNRKTRGLSVYTLSERRAKYEAGKLVKKADTEDVIRGVNMKNDSDDVQNMLIGLAQRQSRNTAVTFAETLVKNLGGTAKLLKNTHRSAGFVVLTGANVPSVLVELGYLSNAYEEKQLGTRRYRKKLTGGIAKAINEYFKKYSVE